STHSTAALIMLYHDHFHKETILYSLPCASFGYVMVKTLGVGGFGAVHKCVALDTKELVALKIVKKEYAQYGKREVRFLERLRKLDPHKNNLVLFNRHLLHNETFMLEFEMLNMTIDDLIMSCARPLHLSEIQVITQQMLVALNALRSRRIVHADIKPDNIMLVNHKLQPLKVKLIDFGMAHTVAELSLGDKIQYLSYRAPEVLLGLHLNEAIDMWALGCVMADMLLGTDLFTPSCEFDRLHTACKRCRNRGLVTTVTCKFTSLDDIVKTRPNTTENVDTQAFLSLLKQMMEIDPEKRIIPSKALLHPFISMKDFPSESNYNPDLSSACLTTQRLSRSSTDNLEVANQKFIQEQNATPVIDIYIFIYDSTTFQVYNLCT
uniref:Protein kinase domain-containing protein n=1 Tax=Scophthalmus maximus TaxID=52904 RepID=A0A8D3E3D6_SCOMX